MTRKEHVIQSVLAWRQGDADADAILNQHGDDILRLAGFHLLPPDDLPNRVALLEFQLRKASQKFSWLADYHASEIAQPACRALSDECWKVAAGEKGNQLWDCNICGGTVDLSNPVAPSARIGPGQPPKRSRPPELG